MTTPETLTHRGVPRLELLLELVKLKNVALPVMLLNSSLVSAAPTIIRFFRYPLVVSLLSLFSPMSQVVAGKFLGIVLLLSLPIS